MRRYKVHNTIKHINLASAYLAISTLLAISVSAPFSINTMKVDVVLD